MIKVRRDGNEKDTSQTKEIKGADVGTCHGRRTRMRKDVETDYVRWTQQTRYNYTGTIEIGTREEEDIKDKEAICFSNPTIERSNNKTRADQVDGAREQEQDKGTTDQGLSMRNRNKNRKEMSMERKKWTGS